MRIYLLLAMAAGVSFIGSNCGGSGVGDPCIPEEEYSTNFSGFSVSEVNVESRSFSCQTRVCLVNHFQGRVSCPYGQAEDPLRKDTGVSTCAVPERWTDDPQSADTSHPSVTNECQPGGSAHGVSCRVPDRDGSRARDRINVVVEPQFSERTADDAVYCSCRCEGPDPNARYCECPSGFVCEELVDELGLGKGQLAGSYCVKEGTEFTANTEPTKECSPSSGDCGNTYERGSDQQEVGINPGGACLPSGAACEGDDTCCVPADNPLGVTVGQADRPTHPACPASGVCP